MRHLSIALLIAAAAAGVPVVPGTEPLKDEREAAAKVIEAVAQKSSIGGELRLLGERGGCVR